MLRNCVTTFGYPFSLTNLIILKHMHFCRVHKISILGSKVLGSMSEIKYNKGISRKVMQKESYNNTQTKCPSTKHSSKDRKKYETCPSVDIFLEGCSWWRSSRHGSNLGCIVQMTVASYLQLLQCQVVFKEHLHIIIFQIILSGDQVYSSGRCASV